MKRLDCSEAEKLIVFDLDESLDADEKESLESHVRNCPSCMRTREEFRALFSSVVADVPRDPGEDFWRRYDSTLAAALREKEQSAGWWGFRWRIAGALFATIFAAAVVFTSLHDWNTPQTAPEIAGQTVAGKLLIQELDELYGPSSEDYLPTLKDSAMLTEAKITRGDETVLGWFEVEDESGNSLL
jgi:hypothetical protein